MFKSGGKFLLVNYRPISILPFKSKIVEKTVHSRMSTYLNKYNLLHKKQFGFPKNKSTCDAVLNFTDLCYNCFNSNKILLSVFLDFSKAFDTVDNDIILKKNLNAMGKGVL